ncbi:MAG: acetolactate decarboxylase [Pirellulales bacterium]
MLRLNGFISAFLLLAGILGGRPVTAAETDSWDGQIVQYGKMHEAIGQQQHQGRVQLNRLIDQAHFYGVGALAKLEGEVTLVDGQVTVTRVNRQGQLAPNENDATLESATLLVGAYVPSWVEQKVAKNVSPDDFDNYIADAAAQAGLQMSKPFVFVVEGEFRNLSLHVINGACPLHARLKKIAIPRENQPFEAELERVNGAIIGIYAKDAVGSITHPATSTHMHLVFKDEKTGKLVTGHVEQIGLQEGALLRLPHVK